MRKITFALITLLLTLGACTEEEAFYPYASMNPSFELIYDYNFSESNNDHRFDIAIYPDLQTNVKGDELFNNTNSLIELFNITQNKEISGFQYDDPTAVNYLSLSIPFHIEEADASPGDEISIILNYSILMTYNNDITLIHGSWNKQFQFIIP